MLDTPIVIQIPLEQIYSCDIIAVIASEKTTAAASSFDHVRANESTVASDSHVWGGLLTGANSVGERLVRKLQKQIEK